MDIKNVWDDSKTVYKLNDDQTGSFFELMEYDEEWNIIIWCGT